jgi:hypothetical protein
MSKGPGAIESRIADLFAATRDRALSIDEIARHAFVLRKRRMPTRAQRLSATRAAHRLLRRVREADERSHVLRKQARANTTAALGREAWPIDRKTLQSDDEYNERLESDPLWIEAERLHEFYWRIGVRVRIYRMEDRPGRLKGETDHWCATTLKGRLYFHPADVPVEVWAVTIDASGVHWFDAEIAKITERNVVVRYAGESARLNREYLYRSWAWWRRVMFVSSRTGRIADKLDEVWWRRYGAAGSVPPKMQMPLEQARLLLGVAADYSKGEVIAAFRRKAKEAHPDHGGTAEQFCILVEARDRLLAALGTSAPPPKMPEYAPTGTRMVYRTGRRASNRLASETRQLT